MHNTEKQGKVENLDRSSRVLRAVVGSALITCTMMATTTPLGWVALLPLIAIYPIFTAITAWDPIKTFFCKSDNILETGLTVVSSNTKNTPVEYHHKAA